MGDVRHGRGGVRARIRQDRDRLRGVPEIETLFGDVLDESLAPRGPLMLFDLVAAFGLSERSAALDVGCGEGGDAIELARRFGFDVTGVDPVARNLRVAAEALSAAAATHPALTARVRFRSGIAEELPFEGAAVDLVWCRDVLVHVPDLARAYAEFRRVLRPGGRALTYQMLATELLEERELSFLCSSLGVVAEAMRRRRLEEAVAASGLRLLERIELMTEWGEWLEEDRGVVGRKLLHAARLLRCPERYVARFGQQAYDIKLADCLWHLYAMTGKLTRVVDVLAA